MPLHFKYISGAGHSHLPDARGPLPVEDPGELDACLAEGQQGHQEEGAGPASKGRDDHECYL